MLINSFMFTNSIMKLLVLVDKIVYKIGNIIRDPIPK